MFIEILKTFSESRVEFKILHSLYPLGDPPPIRLLVDWRVPYSGCWAILAARLRRFYPPWWKALASDRWKALASDRLLIFFKKYICIVKG